MAISFLGERRLVDEVFAKVKIFSTYEVTVILCGRGFHLGGASADAPVGGSLSLEGGEIVLVVISIEGVVEGHKVPLEARVRGIEGDTGVV